MSALPTGPREAEMATKAHLGPSHRQQGPHSLKTQRSAAMQETASLKGKSDCVWSNLDSAFPFLSRHQRTALLPRKRGWATRLFQNGLGGLLVFSGSPKPPHPV